MKAESCKNINRVFSFPCHQLVRENTNATRGEWFVGNFCCSFWAVKADGSQQKCEWNGRGSLIFLFLEDALTRRYELWKKEKQQRNSEPRGILLVSLVMSYCSVQNPQEYFHNSETQAFLFTYNKTPGFKQSVAYKIVWWRYFKDTNIPESLLQSAAFQCHWLFVLLQGSGLEWGLDVNWRIRIADGVTLMSSSNMFLSALP